jgi:hypothetical protein
VVPATSTSSTVTIRVAATGAATGAQSFSVTATGDGTIAATPLSVGVTVVTQSVIRFCAADAPLWVAMQDGDSTAAWTRLPTTGPNTYTVAFSGARGAIARVDTVSGGTQTSVVYLSASELPTYGARANNLTTCGTSTVAVQFSGVSFTGANSARVSIGPVNRSFVALPFTLRNVVDGPVDFVATRYPNVFAGTVDRVVLRRGITLTDGQTLPLVDFTAAEAIAPDSGVITITGASASAGSTLSTMFTGDQGVAGAEIARRDTVGVLTQRTYALPVAQLGATALQALQFQEFGTGLTRTTRRYFRALSTQTISLGAALSGATVERAATAPYARPRLRLTSQTDYARSIDARFASSTHAVVLSATSGYFGTLPSLWSLTLPDFSAVAGWQASWGPGAAALNYTYTATGGVDPRFDAGAIVDGAVMRAATTTSVLTLP